MWGGKAEVSWSLQGERVMLLHEQLAAAKEVISIPEQWSQKALAENKLGQPIAPTSSRAIAWCPLGALMKATGNDQWMYGHMALIRQITKRVPCDMFLSEYNSAATHEEIMALFDCAIKAETPHE